MESDLRSKPVVLSVEFRISKREQNTPTSLAVL